MTAKQLTDNQRPQQYAYCVADFRLRIVIDSTNGANSINLLPSFVPFIAGSECTGVPLLFTLTVKDELDNVETCEEIGCFDTGNGDIIVHRTANGGYHYEIKNIYDDVCCVLVSDSDFINASVILFGDGSMRTQEIGRAHV